MSTLENDVTTEIIKISIGRRIAELMQEKGEAFSIRAFSSRIGVSRETLRLILVGERPISSAEIERIADGLGVTVERLRQLDIVKHEREITSVLRAKTRTKVMLMRALSYANEAVNLALGMTEHCHSLMNLGRLQFYIQEFNNAHKSLTAALDYAKLIYEKFGNTSMLHQVSSLLMVSYTVRKEYTNVEHLLNIVETVFCEDPEKMGYVHYTRMKWHEHQSNIQNAKAHSYLALEFFEKTDDMEQIGKAMINVSHFEYKFRNYQESARILQKAIDILQPYEFSLLFAVKEFVKVLIRLRNYTTAIEFIEKYSFIAKEYPDLNGKLQIMYSIAMDNPKYAEAISDDFAVSITVRQIACSCLMNYYSSKDDSESLMRYYKKRRMLSNNGSDLFEEEAI